ncbi:CDP-alcohol phosphatidyltransferase [Candidatus Arcanobacter lacustris]|jgi:CDP-diacylglycerol--serine O-phosphatidyltransferase|uniref:CDP-diacylglycerol--serine O-phosphatidyltransferase n=1 Tax=Candidatus Arcanibacter lacustris TaxID=1607817 RepID=A0A0F5MRU6_9RICK|nr:CDP-alcohol phosphatidyltransferase [Candidatus Arcanobacter lacustris]
MTEVKLELIDGNKETNKRFKILPIRSLFPNIITLVALCAGMSSIKSALSSNWQEAVTFIIIAAFLDGMDGRLARYLKATSDFGAQLDSLADFVNFGVAPALILYLWKLQYMTTSSIGWAIALFFSACMSLRLARFNTGLTEEDTPIWADQFFVGIPAPIAACLSLLPMMIQLQFSYDIGSEYIAVYSVIVALFMVSRIPTFSIKKLTIRREYIYFAMIFSVLLVTSLLIKPWITVIFLSILYLFSIPMSIIHYYKFKNSDNK